MTPLEYSMPIMALAAYILGRLHEAKRPRFGAALPEPVTINRELLEEDENE